MDSGLYIKVFSSWEVIVVSLLLMLFLPLVFYVASTRSKPRKPAPPVRKPAPRKAPAAPKPSDEDIEPSDRQRGEE